MLSLSGANQARPFGLLAFGFFNALTMAVISWNIPSEQGIAQGLYRFIGLCLHFSLISLLLAALISLLSLAYKPARKILAISFFAIAQLVVITNLQIYSLYHFHINGMVLNLLFSGALLENIAFSWQMWMSVILIFAFTIGIQFLFVWLMNKKLWLTQISTKKWVASFSIVEILFVLVNGFADGFKWETIISQNAYIPWLPPISMRSELRKWGFKIDSKKQGQISIKSSAINYPLKPMNCPIEHPLNLVFLVVDSLRSDMVNPETMPFTYSLKKQALDYENHFSGSNSTRYGMFSLYYGLNGTYWRPMLNSERGSILIDTTIEKKFQHFIYGSTRLTFPEFDRTIFSKLRSHLNKGTLTTSAENDAEITDRLINDLQQADRERPFFGFLFYDSTHAFSLPENYPQIFTPRLDQVNYLSLDKHTDPLPFLNLYKTTVYYVDHQIQNVIDHLKEQKLLDKTLVVITSDHGQEFNETGGNYWGHNGNFSQWQTKVPLIMLWPNKSPHKFEQLSSHEDIIPTLMHNLFQCSNPIGDYSTGIDLMTPENQWPDRSLLLVNWNDQALLYKQHLYLINSLGKINTVDLNYQPQENKNIPYQELEQKLNESSRFINP